MANKGSKQEKNLQAGYDCSFVESLPSDLQSECSICLHVLREPYLVGCCGYRFCRACIEPIQKKSVHKCPLCKKDFSTLPDKQLERILNDKLVYCGNKSDGCNWKGRLVELEKHLNPEPSPGKKATLKDGCQFMKVRCYFCKEMFYRSVIKDHSQKCKQVTCTHCKTHTDLASKMEQHYSICPMYPVTCPNDCGAKPFRKNLPKHINDNCPRTVVECVFSMLGCDAKMERKNMSEHESDVAEHLVLAAVTIDTLKEENEQLKERIQSQNTELTSLRAKHDIKYLHVTNLPPGVNEQKLKCVFGQYGCVSEITMNGTISARVDFLLPGSAKSALSRSEGKGIRLNSMKLNVSAVY